MSDEIVAPDNEREPYGEAHTMHHETQPAIEIVERWFSECIHASPASRDTCIFNYLRQAVDELNARLAGFAPFSGE